MCKYNGRILKWWEPVRDNHLFSVTIILNFQTCTQGTVSEGEFGNGGDIKIDFVTIIPVSMALILSGKWEKIPLLDSPKFNLVFLFLCEPL